METPVARTCVFGRLPEPPDPGAGFEVQRDACSAQTHEWDPINCYWREIQY